MNNLSYFNGTTTDNYIRFDATNTAHFLLINESPINSIAFSLNGSDIAGKVLPEWGLEFRDVLITQLFLKSFNPANSAPFSLWFFGNPSDIYPEKSGVIKKNFVPKSFIKV